MSWIKLRHDIFRDDKIVQLAIVLGKPEPVVVGYCAMVWCWFDEQTDGTAKVTLHWLDNYIGYDGFCARLVEIGWLAPLENGVGYYLPDFHKYCSETRKQRRWKKQQREKSQSVADVQDLSSQCPVNVRAQTKTKTKILEEEDSAREARLEVRWPTVLDNNTHRRNFEQLAIEVRPRRGIPHEMDFVWRVAALAIVEPELISRVLPDCQRKQPESLYAYFRGAVAGYYGFRKGEREAFNRLLRPLPKYPGREVPTDV